MKDSSSTQSDLIKKISLLKQHIRKLEQTAADSKRTEKALLDERKRFRIISENAPVGMAMIGEDGAFKYINPKFKEFFGYDLEDISDGKTWFRKAYPDSEYRHKVISAWIDDVKNNITRKTSEWVFEARCKDGSAKTISYLTVHLEEGEYVMTCEDITERKKLERLQSLSAEIMVILNDPPDLSDAISRILNAIKREMDFEAVGIRLRRGDDFPYFIQEGFSNDFLLTENTLVVHSEDGGHCRDTKGNYSLECTCGLVISGQTDPSNPLFTPGGSCWTNNSLPILDLPADQDPRLNPRNRCIHEGFLSVALIPIRANKEIIGLLQLNDRKKDCFTMEMIHFFEGISANIGAALMRKQTEDALKESEERYRIAIEASHDGVAIVQNGVHVYVNRAFLDMFRYSSFDEIIGKYNYCVIHPDDYERVVGYAEARQKGEYAPARYEFKGIRRDGTPIDVEVSVNTTFYKGEKAIFAYLRDNTERKKAEENLKYLSIHDSLTGLHNRFLFEEELRRLSTGRFDPIGIVMCDLDGLKLVNDNLGHSVGDRQLIAAANLLKEQFRSSDIVARIGGDEFAIILPDCSSDVLLDICNRLKQAMMNSLIPDTRIPLMMSIGYAIRTRKEFPIDELLKEADKNMYKDKIQNSRIFREYFNDIALQPFSA